MEFNRLQNDVNNEAFQVYIDILEIKTRSKNVAETTWRRGHSKHGTHIPPFLNIKGGIYTKPIADSGNSSPFLVPKMLKGGFIFKNHIAHNVLTFTL